MVRGMMQHTLC